MANIQEQLLFIQEEHTGVYDKIIGLTKESSNKGHRAEQGD